MSNLRTEVIEIIDANRDERTRQEYAQEVMENGCISGMVSGLIYYTETLAFFSRHLDEISDILSATIEDCGEPIGILLRDWDNADPLARAAHNQNLLAWYAFETICSNITDEE